jgi:hypothetical protein
MIAPSELPLRTGCPEPQTNANGKESGMKLGFASLLAAIGVFVASQARASDMDNWLKVLHAMEGQWGGWGSVRYYNSSDPGSSYTFSMDVYEQGDTRTWMQTFQRQGSSGQSDTSHAGFRITGNFLMIEEEELGGTAFVEFSSPTELAWRVQIADMGSWIDVYYDLRVEGQGISGSMRAERDGNPIMEESWSGSKSEH